MRATKTDLPPITEAEFQRMVLQLAHLQGWWSFHVRPGRTAQGWRTPIQGKGAGFPDLVLCRDKQLIFVELKAVRGALSEQQTYWIERLRAAGQTVFVWRPSDWPEIEKELSR